MKRPIQSKLWHPLAYVGGTWLILLGSVAAYAAAHRLLGG